MSIPGSLLNSVLKYRKQKQQPGGPGVPRYAGQCDFARPVTRVLGGGKGAISGGSQPEVYMGDSPEDYVPRVGFMDIPEPDYGPYEASCDQAPRAPAPQGSGGSRPDVGEMEVEYSDCLMTQELFECLMRLAGRDGPVTLDLEQMAELKASLDLISNARDLEEIVARLMTHGELPTEMPLAPDPINASGPYDDGQPETDYAATDPQDFFERQMQVLEGRFRQFEAMQFGQGAQVDAVFHAQEALFDRSQQGILSPESAMPGPESLDDIIESDDLIQEVPAPGYGPDVPAYDDCLMTPELFGELMHEAAADMTPQEAIPVPYGMGMMQDDIYGEPMPDDMMEPEMMDPDMMPGPMGPDGMPEPPPGP